MKTIKIKFTDFPKNSKIEKSYFYQLLIKNYNLVFSEKPDYVFYTNYGFDYLKYDCVRIFYSGENFVPDFNLCDYGIGFDWLNFGDRYLRLPLYYIRKNNDDYKKAKQANNYLRSDIINRKFCNFIYSNGNADNIRRRFFELLSEYKFVHSGGNYLNNIGGRVADKFEFQKEFKFSIAFENSYTIGYTTEKLIEAKNAGTVPIYWGNPQVSRELNSTAFVNVHDFNDLQEALGYVKSLDLNDSQYLKVLNEPLVQEDLYSLNDDLVLAFFDRIFSENKKQRRGHFQANLEKKLKHYRIVENIKRWKPINMIIHKIKI